MGKYLDRINLDLELKDSRGENLVVGDFVIDLYGNVYQIDVTYDSYGYPKYGDVKNRFLHRYVFKVNKNNLIPIHNFLAKTELESKYILEYIKPNMSYLDLKSTIYSKIKDCYSDKNGSMRGFELRDYLLREIDKGDLVVYINNKGHIKYGIMISSTKVFNEDKTTERVYFVIKIENYTDKEKIIYDDLTNSYNASLNKKENKVSYNPGDIYCNGNDSYLYLGNFILEWEQINKSNKVFNAFYDVNQDYWIKLPLYRSTAKVSDVLDSFKNSIKSSIIVSEKSIDVNELLYYTYYSIDGFKNILTKIPKTALYKTKIDLPSEFVVNYLLIHDSHDFNLRFTFKN